VAVLAEGKSNQDVGVDEFVLDGLGRTVPEDELSGSLTNELDIWLEHGVRFDVLRDLSVERAVFQRADKMTGQIYQLKYNPPPPDVEVVQRADEREDTVKRRLGAYEEKMAALPSYYEERNLLRRVDGVGRLSEVSSRPFNVLGMNG